MSGVDEAGQLPGLTPLSPDERLRTLARELRAGASPTPISAREFLSWFKVERRGRLVVQQIRRALREAGLRTAPDFEEVYIDAPLRIERADSDMTPAPASPDAATTLIEAEAAVLDEYLTATTADPTYRLSRLTSANGPLVTVAPGDLLTKAVTLMLARDYSQLPVIEGGRGVRGVVTWRSIGARWALGNDARVVDDFVDEAVVMDDNRSLFTAVPVIIERDFVLVRDASTRAVKGIVTATDLSEQFRRLTEPFLLAGEIETHMRQLVNGRFTKEEICKAVGGKAAQAVTSVDDLTLGNFYYLLKAPERWLRLGLPMEQETFLAELNAVRDIRNKVMHFDPEGLELNDLITLRNFSRFLHAVRTLGA